MKRRPKVAPFGLSEQNKQLSRWSEPVENGLFVFRSQLRIYRAKTSLFVDDIDGLQGLKIKNAHLNNA